MTITRNKNRLLLASLALLASTALHAYEPENTECIAPADPGGGWDFTCRQVGKNMQDIKARSVESMCERTWAKIGTMLIDNVPDGQITQRREHIGHFKEEDGA